MGVWMAVKVHPVAPGLYDLGRLAQNVGGTARNNLDVAAGGEIYAFRAGADRLVNRRVGLLATAWGAPTGR